MGRVPEFQLAQWLNEASARAAAAARPDWTAAEVEALMAQAYAEPGASPGDQRLARQRLSSAFLAGVAAAHEAQHGQQPGSLLGAAVTEARTLLKNRAATAQARLWNAFRAGQRAARPPIEPPAELPLAPAVEVRSLKLFVRQPLTESGESHQALIADVLQQIDACNGQPQRFDYLTGRKAESAATFRASFEAETGRAFTPAAFRAHRLQRLAQAGAFVNIRVGMSESSAFELSYHVFRGACTPILFLVWKHAPIKTTLLKDLHDLCDVTYLEFEQADDLRDGIARFFERLAIPRVAA